MPRGTAKLNAKPEQKKKPLKKKNGYSMPESIPSGEVLTDLLKTKWRIGPSIGVGGFGEIYSACLDSKPPKNINDYEYVVKIEPHGNGPLFVEMHFYMRNAKQEDIKNFAKNEGLKTIGMPYLLGNGSHEINTIKHRFIVMPRYSTDIWTHFLKNDKKIPEHTIYRLSLQMLDVYEYIHSCKYVHGDLKGANILLGLKDKQQAYLVDFGLASHYTTKDFKPDSKKMHNGTIEYTSRDAHQGVPTMRSDLEILGYNLVHWSGVTLPWETEKLLGNPVKVQQSKEVFMTDIKNSLKKLYGNNIPDAIHQYLIYVAKLEFDQKPDYNKCRKIFENGLNALGKSNCGDLEFSLTKSKTNISKTVKSTTPNKKTSARLLKNEEKINDEIEVIEESPDIRPTRRTPLRSKRITPTKRKVDANTSSESTSKKLKITPETTSTPNIRSQGKTIINDNLTPNPKSNKTYEFNFELDVSVDANIVVNVKRKKKANENKKTTETPEPRVRIRRLQPSNSPRNTPKSK